MRRAGAGRNHLSMRLRRVGSNAAITLVFGLCIALAPADPSRADSLSNAQVVSNLMEIMFGSEFVGEDSSIVRKWSGPMRLAIYAQDPAHYRDLVEPILAQLREITGIEIQMVDRSASDQNAYVLVLGREQFYAYAQSHLGPGKDPRTNSYLGCFGIFAANSHGTITEITAVLPDFIGDADKRACVIEEVAQSLGLPNDSFMVKPSIFNDDDEYEELTWQDELFLRVLYDRRVQPGMTRAEFELLARRIADELRQGR